MAHVSDEALRAVLAEQLACLRTMPYAALRELPDWKNDEREVDGVACTFTVYREGDGTGPLKIVVQIGTPRARWLHLFSTGQVLAAGFEIAADGNTRDLPEKDLYDYM
jgi:hypothetical protein